MSKNKYLEKVASLFPSMGYRKHLNEDEKKEYVKAYGAAPQAAGNFGHTVGSSLAIGLGAAAGNQAGRAATASLADRAADRAIDKHIMQGEHELANLVHHAAKAKGRVRTVGALTGMALGIVPGAIYSDHFRHNHAKSVVEQHRKNNE